MCHFRDRSRNGDQRGLKQASSDIKKDMRTKTWTKQGTRRVRTYTYEQRITAVQTYTESHFSENHVIETLGYPSPNTLRAWYKEYLATGTLHEKKPFKTSVYTGRERKGRSLLCKPLWLYYASLSRIGLSKSQCTSRLDPGNPP